MAIETFKPGPTGSRLVRNGKVVGHISFGGDLLLMPVGSREVLFELHHYCGPIPCNKKTLDPMDRIPTGFWDAFERWDVGGRLVDGELCIVRHWCKACNGSGDDMQVSVRHRKTVGKCKTCNGSRLEP